MSEESTARLFNKIEDLQKNVARLLALWETKEKQCEKQELLLKEHEKRLERLEKQDALFGGGVNVFAWIVTLIVAIWGVVAK